jgi:hypothetical protein
MPLYAVAQGGFTHPGDYDKPELLEDHIGKDFTWKIVNASGVFANPYYRPETLVKYRVKEIDADNEVYKVNLSVKHYGQNEYDDGVITDSDFFLISRDWGASMIKYVVEMNYFWGDQEKIDQTYDSHYSLEWWGFRLINTYTVMFKMNDTNYEILKYTRAEGILISRTAVVNADGGNYKGYLQVELVSFSGNLELSPWYYVIIGGSIFGVIILTLTIGSLESQRKKIMRIREEEIKGKYFLGTFIGLLLAVFGIVNLFHITTMYDVDVRTYSFNFLDQTVEFNLIFKYRTTDVLTIDPIHFVFLFAGIFLIGLMSIKEKNYRNSAFVTGVIITVIGFYIIVDVIIVMTTGGAFTINPIPGWQNLLMFPVGIELVLLGLAISITLAFKEDSDSKFLAAYLVALICIGFFFLIDYLINIVSNFTVDLLPFDLWSAYLSGHLGLMFIFIIPLISFLVFARKR